MSIFNRCCAGTLPKVQTNINIWRNLIVRKLWIGLIYLPHLTQAFCAVVELWCSHTHAPVQLLQQEATYTLHYLKIREINQDLWGYWNTLQYMHSGICKRSRFPPHFTSASMRYCSPSLCRNFLTEASLSLTPCCLLKRKLWHRIRCTTSIMQQIRTPIKIQAKLDDCVHKSKKFCTLRRFFFWFTNITGQINVAFLSDVFVHSGPP